MHNVFAHTEPGHMPAYISVNYEPNSDRYEITVRSMLSQWASTIKLTRDQFAALGVSINQVTKGWN